MCSAVSVARTGPSSSWPSQKIHWMGPLLWHYKQQWRCTHTHVALALFLRGLLMRRWLYIETALTCGIRQSDVYYACKLFPPSCAHCGETEDLNVNQTLLGQYHVVHPICTICKEQGLPYPHSKRIDHAKTLAQQARVQKLRAGTTKVTVDKKRKRGIDSALDTEGLIQPQQP